VLYYWCIQSLFIRSCFKTQFPLRTAAISSRFVVGTKFVLDVALATPAAILNLRLARENFARSRNESSFETAYSKYYQILDIKDSVTGWHRANFSVFFSGHRAWN
jgi:hypothetical protein